MPELDQGALALYANRMRVFRPILLILLPLGAWAQNSTDDLGRFMSARGLAPSATAVQEATVARPDVLAVGQVPSAVTPSTPSPAPTTLRGRASELVVSAMSALGVPYRRGGNSFESGFDCSGFVRAMYEQTLGLLLPRRASEQAAATRPIDRGELQPGDLVFFNTMRRAFSHVGIYVGDSKFIHSPKPGAAVRIEDLRTTYWNRRFDGARRVTEGDEAPEPLPTLAPSSAPSLVTARTLTNY